jgi:hypothetical protein
MSRLGFVLTLLFALADPPDEPKKLELRVGKKLVLELVTVQTVCDDPEVVRVEADGKALTLTGLKEGRTLCSFAQAQGLRRLYEVRVRP